MEDQILDACGARVTGGLLMRASVMAECDKGVLVMHPLQRLEYMKTGTNYYSNAPDVVKKTTDILVKDSLDIPVTEIHFETVKGRVKVINIASPE